MTCIVGIAHKGTIYLGADSASGDSNQWVVVSVHDAKLFQRGPFAIGFTGSWRMGQVLKHHLVIPARAAGQTAEAYLVVGFIEAVRKCLKDAGILEKEKDVESGGLFLLGFEGKLYRVDKDFHVGRPLEGWSAIGCGYQFALGALHATRGWEEEPKLRMESALTAAEKYSAYVQGPMKVLAVPPPVLDVSKL